MKEFRCVDVFSIPIYTASIDVTDIEKFFNSKLKTKKHGRSQNKQCDNLIHYYNDTDVLEKFPQLKDLKESILEAGNFFYKQVLNYHKSGDLKITNSWFNLCQVDGWQQKHNHSNSVISGTLYINVDENSSITFCSPLNASSPTTCTIVDEPDYETPNSYGYKYHYGTVNFRPSIGECVFWPSYLYHGYGTNKTKDRLSLSFNMIPTKFNSDYQV